MNKKILAFLIALVLIATPLVMIASSTDTYAHPGGGNNGGGNNNGGGGNGNNNGGNQGGGNNNGNGNNNGGGNGNGGNNGGGNGNNHGDDDCQPALSEFDGHSGQMIPRCPLCKQEFNYTDNIRAYEFNQVAGGTVFKQFYLCPKCGFNNAVDKNGIVILDLNTYQLKLMNYKKFNGTTIVPDYDLFRYNLPKQSYPVSLPYMK